MPFLPGHLHTNVYGLIPDVVSLQDKGRLCEGDKMKGRFESNSLEGVVTNECGEMTRA